MEIFLLTLSVSLAFEFKTVSSSRRLQSCIETISKEYWDIKAWTIIYNSEELSQFPLHKLNIPHTLINTAKNIPSQTSFSQKVNFYHNYLMVAPAVSSFKTLVAALQSSSLWENRSSKRGHYLLLSFRFTNFTIVFKDLWSLDLRNIMVLQSYKNKLVAYTATPYDQKSSCGQFVNLQKFEICSLQNDEATNHRSKSTQLKLPQTRVSQYRLVVPKFKLSKIGLYETKDMHPEIIQPVSPQSKSNKLSQFEINQSKSSKLIKSWKIVPFFGDCKLYAGTLNILYGPPFVLATNINQFGLFVDPLKLIAEALGITVIFRNISTDLQINFLKTGSKAFREAIFNGPDDIVVANGNRYIQNFENNDMTEIFFYDDAIWLAPKPPKLSREKILSKIFNLNLWIAISTVVLIASAFMSILTNATKQSSNFFKTLLDVYQMTINMCVCSLPSSSALRIIIVALFMFSLHIAAYFQGRLGSILTHPGLEKGISNLKELSASNFVYPLTYLHHRNRLMSFNDSIPKILGQKAVLITTGSILETYLYLLQYKNASLTSYISIFKYYEDFADDLVIIGKEYLLNMEATYSLRPGHPLLTSINKIIRRIQEAGFQKKWLSDMVQRTFKKPDDLTANLSFRHLEGSFVILAIGFAGGFVAFVLEIIWNRLLIAYVYYKKSKNKSLR